MIWLLQYRGQLGHPASLLHVLDHLALGLGLLHVELGLLHVNLGVLHVDLGLLHDVELGLLRVDIGPLHVELGMLAGKVARKLLSLGSCVAARVTLPAFRLEM